MGNPTWTSLGKRNNVLTHRIQGKVEYPNKAKGQGYMGLRLRNHEHQGLQPSLCLCLSSQSLTHDYFVLFHYSRPSPLSVTIFLSDSFHPQGGTFQMVSYLSQVKSHGRARVLCHIRTWQSQHAHIIFLGGKASPRRLGGICRDKDILYPLLRDDEFEEKRLNN